MMKKFLSLLIAVVLTPMGVSAAPYHVDNIPIEAEMESAQEAREVAIKNGETEAFWTLMKQIVPPEYISLVELNPDLDLTSFVQNVSLSDEKASATKYMASLTVRFKEREIQSFLTDRQIPYLAPELPPLFVVPVFTHNHQTLILEEGNPLYDYLKQNPADNIVLPTGDADEIIQAQTLYQQGGISALTELARTYDPQNTLLLSVFQQGPYVSAHATLDPAFADQEIVVHLTAFDGQVAPVLPELMKQVLDKALAQYQQYNLNQQSRPSEFWFEVPIQNLAEWTVIQQKLTKIKELKNLTIRGFKPKKVLITFEFKGGFDSLTQELNRLHLQLNMDNDSLVIQRSE